MKVLIIEPFSSGHHMAMHLKTIIRRLSALDCKLALLSTHSAVKDKSYLLVKEEMSKKIDHYFLPEFKSIKNTQIDLLLRQIKIWFILKKKISKIIKFNKPDIILIPTFDWIIHAMAMLGSPFGNILFTGIYIAPKHHSNIIAGRKSNFKDWLNNILFKKFIKIKNLKYLLTIDRAFYKYSKTKYKYLSYKINFIPDFGLLHKNRSSKKEARLKLGINLNAKVILIYGSLSLRKGIKEALAVLYNKNKPKNLVVLISGKPDAEIIELIKNSKIDKLISSKQLYINFKFHNSFEEQQAFAAADAVWLGYTRGFLQSSGVLYQAIHSKLLIIAQTKGIIGMYAKKYKLGVVVSPENTEELTKKIRDLFDRQEFFQNRAIKSHRVLSDFHSPEKFSSILSNLLLN